MNIDQMTDRLRQRFLARSKTAENKNIEGMTNRAQLRSSFIQGRTGATFDDDGGVIGHRRGSFLGSGRRPAILIPNAPGWQDRKLIKMIRRGGKDARVRRTIQRMRANGEEM